VAANFVVENHDGKSNILGYHYGLRFFTDLRLRNNPFTESKIKTTGDPQSETASQRVLEPSSTLISLQEQYIFWKAALFAKNFNELPGHMKLSEQKDFIFSVDYTFKVPLMEWQHGARIREERPGCERNRTGY